MTLTPTRETVAIYLTRLTAGGAELVGLNLARGLMQRGFHVIVVVSQDGGELYDTAKLEFEIVNIESPKTLRSFLKLARFLKDKKPNVLISHYFHCNISSLIANLILFKKVNIIIVEHGVFSQTISHYSKLYQFIAKILYRFLYPLSDKIVAVSKIVAKEISKFSGIPENAIRVIYNPVIPKNFDTLTVVPTKHPWLSICSGPLIVGIGRLSVEKGFNDLIMAFSMVRRHVDARLIILGEGKERIALEALVASLEINDFVDMPGYCSNVYPFLNSADLFVLTSHSESFSNVLVEALACGTPVVSTNSGGPVEILENGKYGCLVSCKDPSSLAQSILNTLNNPDESNKLTHRGRFFTVERSIDSYEELILQVLYNKCSN